MAFNQGRLFFYLWWKTGHLKKAMLKLEAGVFVELSKALKVHWDIWVERQ